MGTDWHPADIKAALEKRGLTLSSLARDSGQKPQAFAHVLRQPRAAAERIISEALGIAPHVIWPSRYESTGRRKTPQPVNNYSAIHRAANAREAILSRSEAI